MEQPELRNIQSRVIRHEVLVERFDDTLNKLTEVSLNVSKLLAVHEQRIEAQEELGRSLPNLIEQRRQEFTVAVNDVYHKMTASEQGLRKEMTNGQKEILSEIKSLRSDMTELRSDLKTQNDDLKKEIEADISGKFDTVDKRVTKLERLSWIVIGGAIVVGFIISQALGILEFGLN